MSIQINVITSINCAERINSIKETWGKDINNLIFYSDHDDNQNDVIKVSDNQRDCGLKTQNRLLQILDDKNKYDWYFFVDDDTYVNIKALNTFIEGRDENKIYGCRCGDDTHPYIQGGAGILIPGKFFEEVTVADINTEWLHPASGFGDLWWGFLYKHRNALLEYHDEIFCNIYTDEAKALLAQRNLNEIVTVHPVRTRVEMEWYTNQFLITQ